MIRQLDNWIGGGSVRAEGAERTPIVSPRNGELIAEAPVSTKSDVESAMTVAEEAFRGWAKTTPGARSRLLLKLADALVGSAERLVEEECRNTGKDPQLTVTEEFLPLIDHLRFFAGAGRTIAATASGMYMLGHESWLRREPLGVVAAITPWNYPMLMCVWKIAPALVAGNTVVLKPSELTPLSSLMIAEIASDVFPPGVFNLLCGDSTTGQAMVESAIPAVITLTGSVAAGRSVARAAAQTLKRVHLELGGKAPTVIVDDVDIADCARKIAEAVCYNAGQDCTAPTRLIVHERIFDNFSSALEVELAARAPSAGGDCPPLISAGHRERVHELVTSVPGTATIHTGGQPSKGSGYFYEPTLITGVGNNDRIIREEVFGPVITAQRFSDLDGAIALANDSAYALAASVWTSNHKIAMRLATEIQAGTVWINTHLPLVAEMPHAGSKHSGYGSDLSIAAVEDYTKLKHIMSSL